MSVIYERARNRRRRRHKLILAGVLLTACTPEPPTAVPVVAPEPHAPKAAPTVAPSQRPEPAQPAATSHRPTAVPDDTARGIPAVWIRLAACESGLRWHIRNPPYSSGVQFIDSSWDAHRPASYPDEAWQATPQQQIFVAKRLLRAAGVGSWPTCGPRVGLSLRDAA